MSIDVFKELALTAFVVVFIVDVSGWSDFVCRVWARMLHVRTVTEVKPLTCSLCMTWWCCLIVAVCEGAFSFEAVAASAVLALMSRPIGALMETAREAVNTIIRFIDKFNSL